MIRIGMSYIAGMFLLNMDSDYQCFMSLTNLLHQELFLRFFQFNIKHMKLYCCSFNILLERYFPKVYTVFKRLGVTPDLYIYEW